MKVDPFHAYVSGLTELVSLPLPFELQALSSHLGSSAVEKTDCVKAMC